MLTGLGSFISEGSHSPREGQKRLRSDTWEVTLLRVTLSCAQLGHPGIKQGNLANLFSISSDTSRSPKGFRDLNSPLARNPRGSLRRTSHTFQRGIPDSYKYDQKIKLRRFPMRTEIQPEKDLGPPSRAAGELRSARQEPPGAAAASVGEALPAARAGGAAPGPPGTRLWLIQRGWHSERQQQENAAGLRPGERRRLLRARGSPRAGAEPRAQLRAVLRRGSPAGHGPGHFQGTRRVFSGQIPEAAPGRAAAPGAKEDLGSVVKAPEVPRLPGSAAGEALGSGGNQKRLPGRVPPSGG